jgi:acyl carrier protein
MITEELKRTILGELGLDDFELHAATLASEVPGWDSLSHVRVVRAVERRFQVRFSTLEVMRLRNVGDLQAAVDRKRPA